MESKPGYSPTRFQELLSGRGLGSSTPDFQSDIPNIQSGVTFVTNSYQKADDILAAAHAATTTATSTSTVTKRYVTYVTRPKEKNTYVIAVRVPEEIGLDLEQWAASQRWKPSELIRNILTDQALYWRDHKPDGILPESAPVIVYRELPPLPDENANARVFALDARREELFSRLERVKSYFEDSKEGARSFKWTIEQADKLTQDFNLYHKSCGKLPREQLDADKEAMDALKAIKSECQRPQKQEGHE